MNRACPALLAVCILLAGCGQSAKKIACSDPAGLKVVENSIAEAVENQMKKTTEFNLSHIRATLSSLNLSLKEIRTAREDPNSTKVFCEATAYLTPTPELLGDVNAVLKELDPPRDVEKVFSAYGLEQSRTAANAYTVTVSYNLQPSDDGKTIFANVEDGDHLVEAGSEILTLALSKQNLMKSLTEQKVQQAGSNLPAATAGSQPFNEKVVRYNASVLTENGSFVVLRAEPGRNSAAKAQIGDSEWVTVVSETDRCENIDNKQGCWVKVQTGSGNGYLFSAYLQHEAD